jgi:hypothetical protein
VNKLHVVKDDETGKILAFFCPGCRQIHQVRVRGPEPRWGWNESLAAPTFTPSVKIWWTYGREHLQHVCHSFVRDGRIEFLGDCTHDLKGQTVDIPEWKGYEK